MKREDEITAALEEVKRLDAEALLKRLHDKIAEEEAAMVEWVAIGGPPWKPEHPAIQNLGLFKALAQELERVRKENVWRPAEEAPRDVPLIVRTERGRVFRACIRFIDADMGWTWCSFEEGDPIPEDWHDDVCWTENADDERSDWPVEFLPLPPQAKGE